MTWLDIALRDFRTIYPISWSFDAVRYLIAAGVVTLATRVLWRRYFAARRLQDRSPRAADYRREIASSVRSIFIFSAVGFGMYVSAQKGWLTIYQDFSVRGWGYFAATLVAMILAHDAYFYWTHRAMHQRRLFRLFHKTHHKSRTPTPWAAYSFDVPEAIVIVAFVPMWIAIVPMHEWAVFAFVSWQIVRNAMGHAGVEMFPAAGWFRHWLGWNNATMHHDLHHQDSRSNYGLYFTWWDRVMGTEHPEYRARLAAIARRHDARAATAGARMALPCP